MIPVLKFVSYTCALAICGWGAFAAFQPLSSIGQKRLARYGAAFAALFLLAGIASIALNVKQLLGIEGMPGLDHALLYLKATALGKSWAWRLGLTAVVLLCWILFPTRRVAWIASFVIGSCALVPVALVSHAATAVDYAWLFVALDWLHLFTISLWFGGLVAIALPGVVDFGDRSGFARLLDRFSTMAMVAVPIAIGTGAFQMINTIDEANDLIAFRYGLALVAKHIFLVPALVLAGYTMLVIKPQLKIMRTPELIRRARHNVTAEAIFVLGMLACTTVMTREIPPSHIGMAGPDVLKELSFSLNPALLLWASVLLVAGSLLVRATFKGMSWSASAVSGAAFALAFVMAVSNQVVILDRPVFRHSTDPAVIARGAELFVTNCALCHGEQGRGDGPLAVGLTPRPTDLTRRHVYHHSDERVLRWITEGIPGTAMPPFGDYLSLEDRQAIVSFVRQLGID